MTKDVCTCRAVQHRAETRAQQFLSLVDGTADAAFAVDVCGRIRAWNTSATELFGVSGAEAINMRCHEILQCSDENEIPCSADCVIERAAQNNRPSVNFDLRLRTKTGKLWCNVSTLIAGVP